MEVKCSYSQSSVFQRHVSCVYWPGSIADLPCIMDEPEVQRARPSNEWSVYSHRGTSIASHPCGLTHFHSNSSNWFCFTLSLTFLYQHFWVVGFIVYWSWREFTTCNESDLFCLLGTAGFPTVIPLDFEILFFVVVCSLSYLLCLTWEN